MADIGTIRFYVATDQEKQEIFHQQLALETMAYKCAGCGSATHGRVVARAQYGQDGGFVWWCYCACGHPTTILLHGKHEPFHQFPRPFEFLADRRWPDEIRKLFIEAARCFAAEAYTAASMLCRKALMVCAVAEGEQDGKNFTQYVDYITDTVLTYPKARAAIDAIRTIGNEANHDVQFVSETDARRAMVIVSQMLDAIYSLPGS